MFCPECRTELPEDAKYCIKCSYDFTKIKTPPERKHTSDSPDTLDGSSTIHQPEIEADSFKVGSLFADRYEILSEGRKGGMGAVYKCNDTKLSKINALKVIHPKLLSSKQALSRFRQEVSISQELTHPNIVRVYNLEEWQGKEYFTMEWVEGVTLRDVLSKMKKQNRPFSLEEANTIISQLSDALHYAHSHTVHRDIKPENILVETDEVRDETAKDLTNIKIKLTDFGIAKMLSPSRFTMSSMQMGTPYYMAPEQKTDAGTVDKRADIYAAGVVLFELLTLENTIGLELPSEINRELPKEIDSVIKKAVATKPDMRYGDVSDLFNELNKIVVEDKRWIEEEKKKSEDRKRREAEEQKQEQERIRKEAEERKLREERERQQRESEEEEYEAQIRQRSREKRKKETSKGPKWAIIVPAGVCVVIGIVVAIILSTGSGNKGKYVSGYATDSSAHRKTTESRSQLSYKEENETESEDKKSPNDGPVTYEPQEFCSGWDVCDEPPYSGSPPACQSSVYKIGSGSLRVYKDNYCWKTLPAPLKGTVEFTAWALPARDRNTNFTIILGSSSGSRSAVGIRINESNRWFVRDNVIANYSMNWTKVRISINTDQNMFSVWLDDVLVIEDVAASGSISDGIDLFSTHSGRGGSPHSSYIDDIRMSGTSP